MRKEVDEEIAHEISERNRMGMQGLKERLHEEVAAGAAAQVGICPHRFRAHGQNAVTLGPPIP
jgi:hypothetical protein